MNALLTTIDLMLATAAIYGSIQLHNALFPADGSGMTRIVRQWLVGHLSRQDHILIGAYVVGLHGILGTLLAVCAMPYAALVVCLCAIWNSARVMQALALIKCERYFA